MKFLKLGEYYFLKEENFDSKVGKNTDYIFLVYKVKKVMLV